MTGKSAGGHATQGESEERKEGQADGQFIHSDGNSHGWDFHREF